MNKTFLLVLLVAAAWLGGVPAAISKDAKTNEAALRAALNAALSEKIGGASTASFGATTPTIFLNYQDAALNKGDKIRAAWILEDGGPTVNKNVKVSESNAAAVGPRSKGGYFQLNKPASGWPLGKYRVEMHVGEALVQTLKFTIK